MGGFINILQPLDGIVRIDLGRREGGMAEQFLDGIEVRPSVQQLRGQRVAQDVRGLPAADTGNAAEGFLDGPVHIDRVEPGAPGGLQERGFRGHVRTFQRALRL